MPPPLSERDCPLCQGHGFVRHDLPPEHSDFGKLAPCPGAAHTEERRARLAAQSGLKAHEREYRLDDILQLDGATGELVQVVRGFVEGLCGWLYIWGGPGNGKSLALMATVNESVYKEIQALYITLADLLDLMKATFNRPGHDRESVVGEEMWRKWDTYQARFRRVQEAKLLAIDEFDASKINETGFAREFRNRLIDHRYRDAVAGETFTIFAGNDNPNTLPPWIYDRIRDGRFQVWHHPGQSVRGLMEW